jgi:hypothetical protein
MLPRWIDMIFGVTSRGVESHAIHNIFSPYFFPEFITPAIRADREKFDFVRSYTACFGQGPIKIFSNPHPSRSAVPRAIATWLANPVTLFDAGELVLSLECARNSVTVVTRSFKLFTQRGGTLSPPVQLLLNAQITDAILPMMRALVQTCGQYALTGAPWDTAFTLSTIKGDPLHIKRLHSQRLSALALSEHFFATASFDCTVMLWKMRPDRAQVPYAIISKHKSLIQCLAICEDNDTLLSCSRTGEIVATALAAGSFVRKIRMDIGEPTGALLWRDGTAAVAIAASNRSVVAVFDHNLCVIEQTVIPSAVVAWAPIEWENGRNYVVAALKNRRIVICGLPGLDEVWTSDHVDYDIARLAIARKPRSIVLATVCGKILQLLFEAS